MPVKEFLLLGIADGAVEGSFEVPQFPRFFLHAFEDDGWVNRVHLLDVAVRSSADLLFDWIQDVQISGEFSMDLGALDFGLEDGREIRNFSVVCLLGFVTQDFLEPLNVEVADKPVEHPCGVGLQLLRFFDQFSFLGFGLLDVASGFLQKRLDIPRILPDSLRAVLHEELPIG